MLPAAVASALVEVCALVVVRPTWQEKAVARLWSRVDQEVALALAEPFSSALLTLEKVAACPSAVVLPPLAHPVVCAWCPAARVLVGAVCASVWARAPAAVPVVVCA